jgi:hypothetical protein
MESIALNLDKPQILLSMYALLNRIRLCASDAVLTQAEGVVRLIVEQYFAPNVPIEAFSRTRAQRRHRSAQGIQRSLSS